MERPRNQQLSNEIANLINAINTDFNIGSTARSPQTHTTQSENILMPVHNSDHNDSHTSTFTEQEVDQAEQEVGDAFEQASTPVESNVEEAEIIPISQTAPSEDTSFIDGLIAIMSDEPQRESSTQTTVQPPSIDGLLYGLACPKDVDVEYNNIPRVLSARGLTSKVNILDFNQDGAPLPLEQALTIEFSRDPNISSAEGNCRRIAIKKDDVTNYLNQKYGQHEWIKANGDKFIISRKCDVSYNWKADDVTQCGFNIPHNLIKRSYSGQLYPIDPPSSSLSQPSFRDFINLAKIQKLNIDPSDAILTDAKKLSYKLFTTRWKAELNEREQNSNQKFTLSDWESKYYDRMLAWKDRVYQDPYPYVSLYTHVLIEPTNQDPRSILNYSTEIEADFLATSKEFFSLSEYDGSGVREIQTTHRENIEDMVNLKQESNLGSYYPFALKDLNYVQHGGFKVNMESCGSHNHIKPKKGMERIIFRTFRPLIGLFAPFYAGVDITEDEGDFMFRKDTNTWAGVPKRIDDQELNQWGDYSNKNWWITPHTYSQHHGSKPLTFEIRANEAIPQISFTASRLIGRIADGFMDMGIDPIWTSDFLTLAKNSIPYRTITKIDDLKTVVTNDPVTAEVLSKVLQTPIKEKDEISLKQLLRSALKNVPMRPWEKFWAYNVLGGVTWSKILGSAQEIVTNNHDRNDPIESRSGNSVVMSQDSIKKQMRLTKSFINYFPDTFEKSPAEIDGVTTLSLSDVLSTPRPYKDEDLSNYHHAFEVYNGTGSQSTRSGNLMQSVLRGTIFDRIN